MYIVSVCVIVIVYTNTVLMETAVQVSLTPFIILLCELTLNPTTFPQTLYKRDTKALHAI